VTAAHLLDLTRGVNTGEDAIGTRLLRHIITGGLITVARAVTGAEARWVGCAPSESPRIYIANHTSHADFILLWAALTPALRSRTRPVAAAEYWGKNPVRRYLAEAIFRSVLIERDRVDRLHDPITPILKALDRGCSLIMFPEGTRGDGAALQPFKSGLFHVAELRPDIELVPVWIDNLYRVLPKGSVVPAPLLCSATFGSPTHLQPGEDKRTFLARMQEAVTRLGEP